MSKEKSRNVILGVELFKAQSENCPYPVDLEDFKLLAANRSNLLWIRINSESMSGLNLSGKFFDHAQLLWNNFTDGSMRHCSFTNANLRGSTYTNVNFYDAGFFKADLESVKFINCNLEGCSFVQADLNRVRGLKTISSGPSWAADLCLCV